jgi:hypothetical protein
MQARKQEARVFDEMVGAAAGRIWIGLREEGASPDCLSLIPALTYRLHEVLEPFKKPCSEKIRARVLRKAIPRVVRTLQALGVSVGKSKLNRCASKALKDVAGLL